MQGLPPIEVGHFLWVFIWALLGMCVSAAAWSNRKTPTYKDCLAGSLGISLEAFGVEFAAHQSALMVPLALALLIALLIRYLPDARRVRLRNGRVRILTAALSVVVVFGFFVLQALVLLLAYRGWWDGLVLYPGG